MPRLNNLYVLVIGIFYCCESERKIENDIIFLISENAFSQSVHRQSTTATHIEYH